MIARASPISQCAIRAPSRPWWSWLKRRNPARHSLIQRLESPTNPKLRHVRRLLSDKRYRDREGRYVAEGLRLVRESLDAGAHVEFAVVAAAFGRDVPDERALRARLQTAVPLFEVDDGMFEEISATLTPQGVLAVLATPELPLPEPGSVATLALVVDGVRDPGNLGTLLRTAAAAGVHFAFLAPGTVDFMNPKVVRAAAGAHFRLPIRHLEWDAIVDSLPGVTIAVAEASGPLEYTEHDWRQPTALVIGSEAHGPSKGAKRNADFTLRIPMAADTESINAAAAAAVILFEAQRQRRSIDH